MIAPVINSWGTVAYTCNILGFYLFLLCMLLIEFNTETRVKDIVLIGLLTGMALGIKYQAIPLVGCIYLLFFVYEIRNLKRRWLVFTSALLLAMVLASPWFVRNFLITKKSFFSYS